MTEDQRFYSTAENKAKECHIAFPDLPAEGDQEAPTKTSLQEVALDAESLKDIENQINDPKQGKCKIRIEKLVPQGGEEAAKKAPAKGKPAATGAEESKPVVGEAFFDFTPFLCPGATESEQRCFIFTVQEAPSPEEGAEAAPEKADGEEEPVEEPKPFESRHCYVLIKISLSEAINPAIDPTILPKSTNIAMNAVKNIPQGFPNVVDAVEDYQNSIYNIVLEISTEYSRQFEGEEDAMQSPMAVTSQSSLKSSQNA